ncbi:hypothetical protein PMAYCL1PPCAC_17196 [Pristionchus mayeri]|uniref:G protein-coupled receptor n=1 Tax=Pristionchus mayeri TaxID=1317129 RepID=A0AAN5CMD8_9BILA|nr:hypothetical protein PMAYCL1PPCAC_17181 [Pristionchus mayeri]GMR46990.1 hypothetical protein PMAYCL1PPCAC_17185 [Pristionchus mayeri]GMR47001.1 hypothetical protein PMAYCL1PPCAC_17196 [Pristionchus mayeri]
MTDSQPFIFLNEHPIFPLIALVINLAAFIPMLYLLFIAQIAPLHNNCRYILSVWTASYGVLFIIHIALVYVDFTQESGYMPLTMFEPPGRFELYKWHVRCTTYSSSFEIVLSIERIVAVICPRSYHFSGMAWKLLISITICLMFVAYVVDAFVHSGV